MLKLSKIRVIILVMVTLVVLAALSLGAVALISGKDISPSKAITAVRNFAKVNTIKSIVKDEFKGKRSVYEIVSDDNRVFWVDAKTGKVTGVVGKLDEEPVGGQDLPLTKEAARERAENYIKNKFERFEELELINTTAGPGNIYTFTWQKVDDNGARYPRWATITVDTETGKLGSYASRDEEIHISTKPQVSKDEAIQAARAKL
ncbi:MAG: PepSY domain-containing protein [Actinobacteria bacterium]|nr:PepSY domain-containing protein [Actinomycetota bacterium]